METDQPVFKGYLFFPSSGKILKKAWQKKFCILHKSSSSGIARLEIYENEAKTSQSKIITLEDVIKITPKSPNIINVVTKNSDLEFGTMSDENLNNWFGALKSVAFPDETIEQDNDLYCSANEGVFSVKLHPSEASQRCKLASKNYTLVVTPSALHLRNESNNMLLYIWPFRYIRKYGYKGDKFTFEAGRKCSSGEGVFYLEHPNRNEIYRCLTTKMENMKKQLNGESMTSLIDGDMQLHAALNMEAGSRNPLPLSMSAQSSFQEPNKSSLALHFRPSMSFESLSVAKSIPKKPPRKSLPLKNVTATFTPVVTINHDREYAEVNVNQFNSGKYDSVEKITDAWKTMGVEEPSHSELSPSNTEDIYASWGTLAKPVNETKISEKNSAPAVITEPTSPVSQFYDCLNHFGSSSALNVSSDYKKIIPQVNKSIENLSYNEETLPNCDEAMYTSWGTRKLRKSVSEMKLTDNTHAPTVISEPIQLADVQGYDHLNFFGQSSGLTVSSDYKQVISATTAPPAKTTFNLYEEVNVMESARSADDSHLGYARIKKDGASGALKEVEDNSRSIAHKDVKEEPQRVVHEFQNHQPYAVISKPKRV